MSLATSCPSCGTVFKVVEDQLKISEGWVRCGHCHDVFNALEGLFDLQRKDSALGALAAASARSTYGSSDPQAQSTPLAHEAGEDGHPTGGVVDGGAAQGSNDAALRPATVPAPAGTLSASAEITTDRSLAGGDLSNGTVSAHPPPVDLLEADTVIPSDASLAPGAQMPAPDGYTHDPWPATEEAALDGSIGAFAAGPQAPDTMATRTNPDDGTPGSAPDFAPLPSFVDSPPGRRQLPAHQQRAGWALAGVLAIGLVCQVMWHWREELAVRSSMMRLPLQLAGRTLGHPLEAPAQADAVEVENAALTHPPGATGFKLSVQVRNRADHDVAAPHMELSLTDAAGALLTRRVLRPADFQQTAVMNPQGEATWSLEFQADDKRVAGYTVLAFYP